MNECMKMDGRTPQPNLRKTPRGGKMMAIKMSMHLTAPAMIFLLILYTLLKNNVLLFFSVR
jgi:hypothetical protein